jgi:hypothetical protein
MHLYVAADRGLKGNQGGADRSARAKLSTDTRRLMPLPTPAGGVCSEHHVEANSAIGFFEQSLFGSRQM